MKLDRFDGGQASRLAPQHIAGNQGAEYVNIDNTPGNLVPVKDKVEVGRAILPYHEYFNAENIWLEAEVKTDFLEFQRKMYLTDRVTAPQKYSGGLYHNLGIAGPEQAPSIVNLDKAPTLKELRTRNDTTAGDLPIADLSYLLVNVNNGVYSTPQAFVVFASDTNRARVREANGVEDPVLEGGQLHKWVPDEANPIITDDDGTVMRSVIFDKIQGEFGEEARIYRWHEARWRLVGTFPDKTYTVTDSVFDITANEELDDTLVSPFNGTYQYVYTFYNAADGSESVPSPLSEELDANSGKMQIILPSESLDPQVTHKRIYRVGGNFTQFTMVVELDKTELIYVDQLPESQVDGRPLESESFYAAPEGLAFLSTAYAMLFGALGDQLRFTPIGKPNAWPPEYSIQFEDDITGIGPVANGILVMTLTSTYLITGTGPLTLAQQTLRGDQGCVAFESIQQASLGTVIWASQDGLCTSSGNDVQSLTKLPLGDIRLEPVDSVVHDEVYYCHNADGKTLAWDFRYTNVPKWLELGISAISVADNVLYGYNSNLLYYLFASDQPLTFTYLSPKLTEGSITIRKYYKKLFIRSEGDIIINILIDDRIVAEMALTGSDTHQLAVPQQSQSGYSIQFKVTGTGIVHEIECTPGGRHG